MRFFFDLITVLGFILTGLGTYLTLKSGANEKILENEIIRYGGIVLFVSLVALFRYWRKYEIAKSVIKGRAEINEAYIKASNLAQQLQNKKLPLNKCLADFSEICQHISAGFRRFHKSHISVCLQYVNSTEGDEENLYVKALSRDLETCRKRKKQTTIYTNKDYINDNSDFRHIFNKIETSPPEDLFYFNNHLPLSFLYKNSHIHENWKKKYNNLIVGIYWRLFRWKLPYRSTIVVPVLPEDKQGKGLISGFLCVDSTHFFAFSKKFDLVILKEIAATLHPALHSFNQRYLIKYEKESIN